MKVKFTPHRLDVTPRSVFPEIVNLCGIALVWTQLLSSCSHTVPVFPLFPSSIFCMNWHILYIHPKVMASKFCLIYFNTGYYDANSMQYVSYIKLSVEQRVFRDDSQFVLLVRLTNNVWLACECDHHKKFHSHIKVKYHRQRSSP